MHCQMINIEKSKYREKLIIKQYCNALSNDKYREKLIIKQYCNALSNDK